MQRSTIQSQKSILVVDNTPSNLGLLFQYLDNAEYKVFVAQTEERAWQIATLVVPDLILLDVMTSEIDDFSICEKLKTHFITQDIPVIFITALSETKPRVKGVMPRVVDYVTKPVDPLELLARIENHLTIQELTQDLALAVEQRQMLFEVVDRIRQSLDLKSIFQTATAEICQFLNCDRLSLVRLTQNDITIESQAFSRSEISKNLRQLTIEDFDLKTISTAIKPSQLRPNANLDLDSTDNNKPSRLFVPILLDSSTKANQYHPLWGWLVAERCSPQLWQSQSQTFLRQLTIQLSIAIDQGLLYQQLQNSYQQLQSKNQQLKQLAIYDSLTKVYNRRYFQQQLNKEWRRLSRNVSPLSVILCDVDCFKLYNDTYGHQKGDRCLQQIAEALADTVRRPADILARFGGEEFVAILPDTDRDGAIKVAETMRVAIKQLHIPHCNSLVNSMVTISAGVATTIPNAQDNAKMLVEEADKGLYLAKSRGRDCIAVDRHPLVCAENRQNNDRQWDKRIRRALKKNLFSLYAQPITSLKEDSRQHFEILLRLQDRGQVIAPNAFFDVAERNSLMSSIDTWVINQLLEQLANKGDRSYWQNYQFSINLSGASLNDRSFLDFLSQKLTQYHLPPQLFCFEITEAIAITNIGHIRDFMTSLKNLGCSFALDDFGKGMSSLTYLKNLPVDYLKIDGSFITELHTDRVSKVMVEAINHLAVGIGLKTVAEFVENQAILDTLRHLKIDYAQGYHLGRPQKFTEMI
ncbi:MAG TPA: EAL domain-containing protein [Coleofasciculaceae cyanobacterium]|jgi:diguanylate cyclase (GGDEF)-like protein